MVPWEVMFDSNGGMEECYSTTRRHVGKRVQSRDGGVVDGWTSKGGLSWESGNLGFLRLFFVALIGKRERAGGEVG